MNAKVKKGEHHSRAHAEIEALREKIIKLVLENPKKAATILKNWINPATNYNKISKKGR